MNIASKLHSGDYFTMFTDSIRSGVFANIGLNGAKAGTSGEFGDLLSGLGEKKDQRAGSVFNAEGYFGQTKSMTGEMAALYEELSKWADMNVVEKIRAQYLEDRGITEEQLAALPPEERADIEKEIMEAIKRHFGVEENGETAEAPGSTPAVSEA